MIQGILRKIFGSRNDRLLKQYARQVRAINALEPQLQKLSDAELAARTAIFRARINDRLDKVTAGNAETEAERERLLAEARNRSRKEMIEELLPEAFAVVREAARRALNMRHFDVQLVGGI